MRHFLIAANDAKDENLILTKKIAQYISSKGGSSRQIAGGSEAGIFYEVGKPEPFDCIIALGGDGTILKVSRDLRGLNLPIVGVNLGTLGFLAEVEPEQAYAVIDRLLVDDYGMEARMNICGTVFQGEQAFSDVALNDIVITRSGYSRIIGLKIYVNGRLLDIYEADGVVLSTPTGSTGYNLSAGGPIVSPRADIMIVTPISPHSLTSKGMVLSCEDEIVVEVLKTRKAQKEEAIVSFDGQEGVKLSPGDRVRVKKAESVTKMIKLMDVNFYEVLREKLAPRGLKRDLDV